MKGPQGFTEGLHRYLDGEDVPLSGEVRAEAERFAEAMARYTERLDLPGREVEARVVAALGSRRFAAKRPRWWHWLLQPQALRVRPVLVAGLVAVVAGLTWVVARQPGEPGQPPADLEAGAPTVLVRFELRAPTANRVAVSGSFSRWDERGIPLTLNSSTGLWSVTLPMHPGEHQYLFVIDEDRWVPDPAAHAQVDDGFGQVNSVIVVGPRGVVRG